MLVQPLTSLEALPFERHDLRWLLGLEVEWAAPDQDFDRFGWAPASRIVLATSGVPARPVSDAWVIALHNADEPPLNADRFEVEFDAVVGGEELSYVMELERVLSVHVVPLLDRPDAPLDVVLALCNPHDLVIHPPPASARSVQWHWARGDVVSWLEVESDRTDRIVLEAAGGWTSTLVEPTLSP